MIPRVVKMAAEVASTLTVPQLEDYGNIILSGYLESVPNTINKKAWQYRETATAPVNLPSLTQITPALKGWTNNYQEYYTQLQPNAYGTNPGDPTMFEYVVHSYTQETGPISTLGWISQGSGYAPGTYLAVPLTGGTGLGATANIVVTIPVGLTTGPANAVSFVSNGSGYSASNQLFSGRSTTTLTGSGSGLTIQGRSNAGVLTQVNAVSFGGTGYEVGDTYYVTPGTGVGRVDAVDPSGSVTSFTLVNPGAGYTPGDAVGAPILPGGSGFYAPIATVVPVAGTGNVARWSQPPRRLIQSQVADFVPPDANQQAIQYSAILYPSTM